MAKALFEKTKIDINELSMKLTASYLLEFSNQSDNEITIGYPDEWTDYINYICKGNTSGHIICRVYGKSMKHGTYNRVTDHNRIWGILGIHKGDYDGFYDTSEGRAYWGIKILEPTDELLSCEGDFTILIPSNKEKELYYIIDLLLKWKYCFPTITDCDILSLVQHAVQTSILFRLSYFDSKVMLHVFSDNPKVQFTKLPRLSH